MPFTDSQMTKFENHVRKTKRRCPMCGGPKFDFGTDGLVMLRVDARAAVKIVEPDRGRVVLFVNCLECRYYMLFKPEIMAIIYKAFCFQVEKNAAVALSRGLSGFLG